MYGDMPPFLMIRSISQSSHLYTHPDCDWILQSHPPRAVD